MDFVILQVNGIDVSKSSHEEAIRVFQAADEPILVQMLRRSPAASRLKEPEPKPLESPISTLPTCMARRTCCLHGKSTDGHPSNSNDVQIQTDWDSIDFYQQTGELEDDELLDEDQEMEYEEIQLKRVHSDDKLGLTLCDSLATVGSNSNSTEISCESEENDDQEVYIQDIADDSLAASDARLCLGDVIIQINGVDVRNRFHAETLFAVAGSEITLLVSRPHNQVDPLDILSVAFPYAEIDEEFQEDDEIDEGGQQEEEIPTVDRQGKNGGWQDNEKGQMSKKDDRTESEILLQESEWRQDSGFGTSSLPRSDQDPTESSLGNTLTSRVSDDSGRHNVTEQKKRVQIKKSDLDLSALNKKMESVHVAPRHPRRGKRQHNEKDDSDHIYETISECLEQEPIYSVPYECQSSARQCPTTSKPSGSSRTAKLDPATTTNLVKSYGKRTPRSDRMVRTNDHVEQWIRQSKTAADWKATSTSASKHSSSSGESVGRKEKKLAATSTCKQNDQSNSSSWMQSSLSLSISVSGDRQDVVSGSLFATDRQNQKKFIHRSDDKKNCNYVTMLPTQTMYTNAENLQQTIWLQQQLFQQQLLQKRQASQRHYHLQSMSTIEEDTTPSRSHHHHGKPLDNNTKTEWRMKRRPDGSRYITRRPTRDRMLRDRAYQIYEERAGMSTDDDALSELKLGRYWSKEERRQHVDKARERRQRQEDLIRSSKSNRSRLTTETSTGLLTVTMV